MQTLNRKEIKRWDTKRQEISAKSCKMVSPLRHQSNYWLSRSPNQEQPRQHYTLRGSQPVLQTLREARDSETLGASEMLGWNRILSKMYIESQWTHCHYPLTTPPHTHPCGNTDTWKQYVFPSCKQSDNFSLKKWNVTGGKNSVFWYLRAQDNGQQLSWSSSLRRLT